MTADLAEDSSTAQGGPVGICWEVVASWRLFVQTEDALDLVLVERLRIRMEVVMGGTGLQHGDAADRSAL